MSIWLVVQKVEVVPQEQLDDVDPPATEDGLLKHEPQTKTDGTPHDKVQMNFTDSDSRIMESSGSFIQGYNCQAAVDEEHQIIVGQAVSNKAPDNGNLVPIVEQVKNNCGRAPDKTTADAGYWTPEAPEACEQLGTDVYISTRRRKHGDQDDVVPNGPVPEDADTRERMRRKLSSKEGRDTYARRKAVVEPVFGQIKEARGFRRFLLRGQKAVQAEWAMVCMGHNLLKLFRFRSLHAA